MAQTFQARIESLFGKTLGTTGNPSVDDVNQWLEDAQWDIINKLRKSEPEKLFMFSTTTTDTAADADFGGIDMSRGDVIKAMFCADTGLATKQYTQMREMSAVDALAHTNVPNGSLYQPELFSPVYYYEGGKVKSLPRPAAGKTAHAKFWHIYIDNTIASASDTELTDFPQDYLNLVILFGVARCFIHNLSRIATITMTAPDRPVLEELENVSESLPEIDTISRFVAPNLDLESDFNLNSLSSPIMESSVAPSAPDFNGIGEITVNGINYPEYEEPLTAPLYSEAETLLDDEDIELVDAKMKIISGQLNEYKLDLDKAKSKFAVGTAKYQAELKKAIVDGQAELARETKEYENKLKLYQIDVQQKVQEYEKNLAGYVQEAGVLMKEYTAKSGVDLKKFESELQSEAVKQKTEVTRIQSKFARDMKKYEADLQTVQLRNKDKLQKFMMSMQLYAQEYNAKIKQNQLDNQKQQMEYTWMSTRLQQVMAEYLSYFRVTSQRQQRSQQQKDKG